MRGGVQGGDVGVGEGDGGEGPPDHGLIDVDPPGEEEVGGHDGVAETLEDDVVVVLAGWGGEYRLAR